MKNLNSAESNPNKDSQYSERSPGVSSPRRKKIKLPAHSLINKKIIRELDTLIDFTSPGHLSKNIRNIFLIYLYHQKDLLPHDIGDTIEDVQFLLNFLDAVEEETKQY